MNLNYSTVFYIILLGVTTVCANTQSILSTYEEPDKVIYVHPLDLLRIYSPAIKVSIEIPGDENLYYNYEASVISNFNGRYIWSNLMDDRVKSVYGFSSGFYPMVRISDYNLAGLRVNYSFKLRYMEEWVPRFGGIYQQNLDYFHLSNSIGLYYRYEIQQLIMDNLKLSLSANAGILGSYVITNLPEDVPVPNSDWYSNLKPKGFTASPHIYLEFNIGFPLYSKKNDE